MKASATPLIALFLLSAPTLPCTVLAQAEPVEHADAAPDDAEVPAEPQIDFERAERLWATHWRRFAPYYIEHEGHYICVPTYDLRLPSSTGQTVAEYRSANVWQQPYVDERGRDTTRRLTMPEQDAFAAVALIPQIAVGQYGYIHSGNISAIIDEQTVELNRVWLVDADAVRSEVRELKAAATENQAEVRQEAAAGRDRSDRREIRRDYWDRRQADSEAIDWGFANRTEAAERQGRRSFERYTWVVQGYRTANLQENARWPSEAAQAQGLQLLIIAIEDNTITAVPVQAIGSGLNELQLLHCLSLRGYDKASFVELVLEANREARGDYVSYALARLEGLDSDGENAGADNSPPNAPANAEVELAD